MKLVDGDSFSFFSSNEINDINNFRKEQSIKEIDFMEKLNNRPFFDWMKMNNILIIPLIIKYEGYLKRHNILGLIRNTDALELAIIRIKYDEWGYSCRDTFEIPRSDISKHLYRFGKYDIEKIKELVIKKVNYFKNNNDKYFGFSQEEVIDEAVKNI